MYSRNLNLRKYISLGLYNYPCTFCEIWRDYWPRMFKISTII